jgi:hypothetical protein
LIERFNFYDVYGYLLPGLAVIGLAWLPFVLLSHTWPANELLSAVALLAFGYVLGHLLQNVLTSAIPSKFTDDKGRLRKPSDIVLDSSNLRLTSEVKKRVAEKVMGRSQIDLFAGADGDENLSRVREQAFLMARLVLIQEKLVSYSEQFQGLYAMMRGLSVAFFLGTLYLFSWALSSFKSHYLWLTCVVGLGASFATIFITGWLRLRPPERESRLRKIDRIALSAIAVGASASGYLLGFHRVITPTSAKALLIIGAISLLAGQRFRVAYKNFAFEFALSVWRDFAARHRPTKSASGQVP